MTTQRPHTANGVYRESLQMLAPHDAEYSPAPHLVSGTLTSATDLVFYYKDFYESLKYIHYAPELVFERLVSNLNTSAETAFAQRRNTDQTPNEKVLQDLAGLKSAVSKLASSLEKPGDDRRTSEPVYYDFKSDLQSSIEMLKSQMAEVTTAFSLQMEQIARGKDDKDLQTLISQLEGDLDEARSALSIQIDLTAQEKDAKDKLQLSNDKLKRGLEEANLALSRKNDDYEREHRENEGRRWSIVRLHSTICSLEADLADRKSSTLAQKEIATRENNEKKELQLYIDRTNSELSEAKSKLSKQLMLTNEERAERDKLQLSGDRLKNKLAETQLALELQVERTNKEAYTKVELESKLKSTLESYRLLLDAQEAKTVKRAIGAVCTCRSVQHSSGTLIKNVTFAEDYPMQIKLASGFSSLHISGESYLYMCLSINSYRNDGCQIGFCVMGEAIFRGASFSWLEILPTDPDFQCGSCTLTGGYSSDDHHQLVVLRRCYRSPPKVVVWFSGIAGNFSKPGQLHTYATGIGMDSFTVNVDGLQDPQCAVVVSWYVYAADMPGVYSGSIEASGLSQRFDGYTGFPDGIFANTPRVVAGMNRFQIYEPYSIDTSVETSEVTAAGMEWSFGGKIDGVQASFIALE